MSKPLKIICLSRKLKGKTGIILQQNNYDAWIALDEEITILEENNWAHEFLTNYDASWIEEEYYENGGYYCYDNAPYKNRLINLHNTEFKIYEPYPFRKKLKTESETIYKVCKKAFELDQEWKEKQNAKTNTVSI